MGTAVDFSWSLNTLRDPFAFESSSFVWQKGRSEGPAPALRVHDTCESSTQRRSGRLSVQQDRGVEGDRIFTITLGSSGGDRGHNFCRGGAWGRFATGPLPFRASSSFSFPLFFFRFRASAFR